MVRANPPIITRNLASRIGGGKKPFWRGRVTTHNALGETGSYEVPLIREDTLCTSMRGSRKSEKANYTKG